VGALYDIGSHLAAFEKLLEAADSPGLRRGQAAARAAGRLLGIGFTCFVEMTAPGAQFYGVGGAAISAQDGTTVRMEPSGKVTALVGTGSQGQGLDTTYAQVIAQEVGVRAEDITVISGDTAVVPYGGGSWGSRSAVVGAGSATLAARAVREKVLAIAGHLLEANPADLDLANGRACVKGSPQRGVGLGEVAWLAHDKSNALPKGMEPGLNATRHYDPPPMTFTNGSHLTVVEIDRETGHGRLQKFVPVEDCGRIINPMIVEGQMVGGIAQGIGEALFERLPYSAAGQPLATSLIDYLLIFA
jgi:carbon-monoxide dehydrogenase large subunit